jgi:hypothetical protein
MHSLTPGSPRTGLRPWGGVWRIGGNGQTSRNEIMRSDNQSIFNSSVNRIHRAPSIVRPLHNGWDSTEAQANSKQLERKCSSDDHRRNWQRWNWRSKQSLTKWNRRRSILHPHANLRRCCLHRLRPRESRLHRSILHESRFRRWNRRRENRPRHWIRRVLRQSCRPWPADSRHG